MIKRWQERELIAALAARRGVHLTGARQCGKTTLAETVEIPVCLRYTFDDDALRATAEGDPNGFVKHADGETVIIDEVQKVPQILNAIKMVIDHNNAKGQYLLTGSANVMFAKAVKDTLAGRLGKVRLRTLSLGEVRGGVGDFLTRVMAGDLPRQFSDFDKREVIHEAFLGGYPEARDLKEQDRRKWFAGYLDDLLTRDIRDVTEIRKLQALRKVSDWLITYSSKFFNVEDLCRDVGITKETACAYVEALQAIYLFDGVNPWVARDYDRAGKRIKYFAADSGLIANTLGWDEKSVYLDDDRSGKLVESWTYHELAALCDVNGAAEIFQYRDSKRREVDFVVRFSNEELLGIEVKSGSSVGLGDFKHLKWFAENLARERFCGIVLYSGNKVLPFGENLFAVPFAALAI